MILTVTNHEIFPAKLCIQLLYSVETTFQKCIFGDTNFHFVSPENSCTAKLQSSLEPFPFPRPLMNQLVRVVTLSARCTGRKLVCIPHTLPPLPSHSLILTTCLLCVACVWLFPRIPLSVHRETRSIRAMDTELLFVQLSTRNIRAMDTELLFCAAFSTLLSPQSVSAGKTCTSAWWQSAREETGGLVWGCQR